MLNKNVCCGILVLLATLLGCGGGDNAEESTSTPAPVVQSDAPPTSTAEAPQTAANQPDTQPSTIPSSTIEDEGEPFDVKQFLESRAVPEENAAPLYLAAFENMQGATRDAEMLDLEPGKVQPYQVEQALQSAAPVLEQVDQAQSKAASCVFELDSEASMALAQKARAIARVGRVELYWARVQGDPELAAAAIKRGLRLTRDLRRRGELMRQLTSIALDGVYLKSIEEFTLNDSKLTTHQCEQVLALLDEHQQQALDPYEEGLRMEYINIRKLIDDLQAGRVTRKDLEKVPLMDAMFKNISLESINYDAERAACNRFFGLALKESQIPHHQIAKSSELNAEAAKVREQLQNKPARAPMLVAMYMQNWPQWRDATTRGKANLAGVQLLTALRRYELTHGKLPVSLDEAVADTVLKTVPIDPYSGQPMRFAIANRKATVYSTGKDLKDDGGLIDWKYGSQPGDYLFAMGPLPGVRPRPTATQPERPTPPAARPAQPAPPAKTAQVRTWTSTVGSKVEAEFTGVKDDVALLKKRDGTVVRVPLEKLSEQDQAWIRQQVLD